MNRQVHDQPRCTMCGRALVEGRCPFCDGPSPRAALGAVGWLRLHDGRVALATFTIGVVGIVAALLLSTFWRPRGATPAPVLPASQAASPRPAAPARAATGGSVLAITGDPVDEYGNRAVRGYAFVVRSEHGASDLITDYHVLVDDYLSGIRRENLERGAEIYTARIIAVSPDPHVALLRIRAALPPLMIAKVTPREGGTVAIRYGDWPLTTAAVVPFTGPGARDHLSFSFEVSNTQAGAPVLNGRGEVVGVTEPTSQFGAQAAGLGFAVPIGAACAAVAVCGAS